MSLILHYDYSEGSGDTVYDRSGNGNDSLNLSGPDWVDEEDMMDFPNNEDYIEFPDLGIFDGSQSFSFSVYIKPHSIDNMYVIAPYSENLTRLGIISDNGAQFYIYDGSTAHYANATGTISADTWHHIVGVYDSSNGMEIWVDNSQEDTNSWTGSISTISQTNEIGSTYTNPDYCQYDLRIYDHALSSSEVNTLYGSLPTHIDYTDIAGSISAPVTITSDEQRKRQALSDILSTTNVDPLTFFSLIVRSDIAPRSHVHSDSVFSYEVSANIISQVDNEMRAAESFENGTDIGINTNIDLTDYFRRRNLETELIRTVTGIDSSATLNVWIVYTDISPQTDILTNTKRDRKTGARIAQFSNCDPDEILIRLTGGDIEGQAELGPVKTVDILLSGGDLSAQANLDNSEIKRILVSTSNLVANAEIELTNVGRTREALIDIDIAVDSFAEPNLRTDIAAAIETIVQIVADNSVGERLASNISIDTALDVSELRERLTGANINAEIVLNQVAYILSTLFEIDYDIAPGTEITIDTDKLTVEDGSGTNLRKYFEGEWYKIEPNAEDELAWIDDDGSREIEFVIEKEDRSI